MKWPKLRTVNNVISVVVISLCLYTLVQPFLPSLQFDINKLTHGNRSVTVDNLFANKQPQQDQLIIPKLFVTTKLNEGTTLSALEHGVWHRPGTGDPVKGGNMVIAGHRFIYGSNSAFYNLDKLAKGDLLGVWWNQKKYIYQVSETKVVQPTEISIENPTKDKQLTLFTCTPLWTSKERQVIIAKFVKEQS